MAASENSKESNLKRDKSLDLKLVGTVIAGKYKVLEILGQGGFGSVFVVEMTSGIIGDRLAMKILPAEFSQNNMLREQFLNEIRVAMKMVDAHIVQIRDVGVTEGEPEKGGGLLYYTMDYVNGKTLGELIKDEGTLSIWRTLRIARRLLPALKVAHNAGIIHRDLKPANIMVELVGEKEIPRILDFGIATAVIADTELDNSLEGGLKDKKGFVGSPYYMPPEQFQGVEMGFYTDLYSLGVIIYECLTGHKPYTGKTAKEVYKKIKQGPPTPVDELQPSTGKVNGLTEMVTKSLERNPEKRFQSAKEFFETLTDVMSGKNEEPTPPAVAPKMEAQKPKVAAKRRAPGIRKSMSASTMRGRFPVRRKSGLGGIVLVLLGLGAAGMLAFVFKDQLLEMFDESKKAPKESSPVAGTTAGSKATEKDPAGGPATTSGQKVTGAEKPPLKGKDPNQDPAAGTAARMQAAKEELAARIKSHLDAGNEAVERKEWSLASAEADNALEIQTGHPGALLLRARVMRNTNQNIPAIVTLEAALDTAKDKNLRVEILRNLAICHTSLQKPDWALAASKLEQAVALDLKNAAAAWMLTHAYEELKKEKQLEAFVKRAYEAGNKDARIGELYKEIWVLAPQRRKKELEEQTALALKKYSEEDYSAAAKAANKTFSVAVSSKPNIEMAEIAVDSLVKLAANFSHSPRRTPGSSRVSIRGARAALSRLYDFVKDSLDSDEEMKRKVTFYDAKITYLETRNDRANKDYLEKAELKFANLLNQLDSRKPIEMYYEARTWRGLLFASRGQLDGIVEEFQAARDSKNPSLMDLHATTYLAAVHYLKETDNKKKAYELARGRLLNLLKVSRLPDNKKANAYIKLGFCYLGMGILTNDDGDLRKAANRFMEAKKLGFDNASLYEYLGETYRHLDEPIRAAVHYRDAYFKAPSPERCLRAVSHFLESNPRAPQAKELLAHALQKFPEDEKLLKKQLELE